MAFNIENISVKPLNTVNSVIKENVLVKSSLLKFNLSKKRNYSILQGNSILKSHLNYNENILNKKDALIYNKVNPLYINNYNWKRYITSKGLKKNLYIYIFENNYKTFYFIDCHQLYI